MAEMHICVMNFSAPQTACQQMADAVKMEYFQDEENLNFLNFFVYKYFTPRTDS